MLISNEYLRQRQQFAERLLNAYHIHRCDPTPETRDVVRKVMSESYSIICKQNAYQDLITTLEAIEVTTKGFCNISDVQHKVLEDLILTGAGSRILSHEMYCKCMRLLHKQEIPTYPTAEILSE